MALLPPATVQPGITIGEGLIAGLIGGVLMAGVSMLAFVALDIGGFWQPLNLIAAVFDQSWGAYSQLTPRVTAIGAALHLLISAAIGVGIAAVAQGRRGTVELSLVAAVFVWFVFDLLVVDGVNPIMDGVWPDWLWGLAHVVYGLGVGAWLVQASLGRRVPPPEPPLPDRADRAEHQQA